MPGYFNEDSLLFNISFEKEFQLLLRSRRLNKTFLIENIFQYNSIINRSRNNKNMPIKIFSSVEELQILSLTLLWWL